MKPLSLPNSVLPAKLYVILNGAGKVIDEVTASNSLQAMRVAEGRAKQPKQCRVAILKSHRHA
jgi:hypothetical protein